MKKISLFGISLVSLMASPILAQKTPSQPPTIVATGGHTLSVQLQGVRARTGQIMITVCNEAGFDGQGSCDWRKIVPVRDASKPIIFENVPTGSYGVKLFHDVNGNNRLDSNAMGIPREPYAFSNNARGNFGPAKFKDAAFTIDKATTISIRLN